MSEQAETALPGPEEGREVRFALDDDERKSFAATAMQMRFLQGLPLKGGLPDEGISGAQPLTVPPPCGCACAIRCCPASPPARWHSSPP